MNAATAIAALDAAVAGYGQTVELQRTAVDAAGDVSVAESVTCPAKVRAFGPQDLEAAVTDIQVILSPTGLGGFVVPSRDDRVVIAGNPSNIVQVAPLYYGGALVRVNLLCRG
jgi:hypothetical protein